MKSSSENILEKDVDGIKSTGYPLRVSQPQHKMKTLAANHPIKTTLARYIAENTAAAWVRFASACTTRGIEPEVIVQRYCH